jgi:hypothetical protein
MRRTFLLLLWLIAVLLHNDRLLTFVHGRIDP